MPQARLKTTNHDGLEAPTDWHRKVLRHWPDILTITLQRTEGRPQDYEQNAYSFRTIEADEIEECDPDQAEGESEAAFQKRCRPARRLASLELCAELWESAHVDRQEQGSRTFYRLFIEVGPNDDDHFVTSWHQPRLSDGEELLAGQSEIRRADPMLGLALKHLDKAYGLVHTSNKSATDNCVAMTKAATENVNNMCAAVSSVATGLTQLGDEHNKLRELRRELDDLADEGGRVDVDSAIDKIAMILVGVGVSTGKLPASAFQGLGFTGGPAANGPGGSVHQEKFSPRAELAAFFQSLTDEQAQAIEEVLGDELGKDAEGLASLVADPQVDEDTIREQLVKFGKDLEAAGKMLAFGKLLTPAQRANIERAST